jgi:hypothetical protein
LYFNDGTSSQWVEQASGTVISSLVESVGGSTGAISNVMLATALTGQNITVGNLIPSGNLIQSLGSPTNQFKDLYLAGNTIHLGGLQLTNNAGGLSVVTPSGSGAGDLTAGNVTVNGNLIVLGSTTTVSSTTLEIADKNITVAKGAADSAAADGAGITVDGASATFNYVHANTSWTSNQDLNLVAGKVFEINGTSVLSNTTLGSGVTASSLTSFGNSPTLVTPALGTPSAIVLTNATGTASGLTANIANFINVTDDTTTNATRYPFFANGTSGAITEQVSSTKLFFNPSTGLLTSTDYNSSSDKRLKKSIKTVGSALDKVGALRGVTFTWKDSNTPAIGMIAQEVQEVLPEVVTTDDDGYMGIKYTNVIGVLVEAIKELKADFEAYKKTHP